MALKKDTVLVWVALNSHQNEQTLALMTFPKSRIKELQTRLSQAYSRKVKGNRLEKLDWSTLDESNVTFAREYASNLFRISGLEAFLLSMPGQGSRSEDWGWKRAADWLKETYAGCDFDLIFDPAKIRHAKISSWMKKNQIHGELLREDQEFSLPLQTISLLAFWMEDDLDKNLQEPASKIRMQFNLTKGFTRLSATEFLLAGLDKKEKKAAMQAMDSFPDLYFQGTLDRWTKKKLPDQFFTTLNECLELGMDPAQILTSSPNAILTEAQKLREVSNQKIRKPETEIDQLSMVFTQLAGHLFKTDRLSAGWMKDRLLETMDNWIEQPEHTHLPKTVWYLLEQESEESETTLIALNTPFLPLALAQGSFDQKPESICLDEEDLVDFLEERTATKPLEGLVVSESLYERIHDWLIRSNRYLPLRRLDFKETELLAKTAAQPEEDWKPSNRFEVLPTTQTLFKPEEFCDLSESELDYFASRDLSLWQMRMLAKAFARGLSLSKVRFVADSHELDLLIGSCMVSGSKRRFLEEAAGDLSLYLSRDLSLSKMEALENLVEQGIDPDWLKVNLKGNVSLAGIEGLAGQYPLGRMPHSWQKVVLLPEPVKTWMLEEAQLKHPQIDPEKLKLSLMAFEQNLFSLVMEK